MDFSKLSRQFGCQPATEARQENMRFIENSVGNAHTQTSGSNGFEKQDFRISVGSQAKRQRTVREST